MAGSINTIAHSIPLLTAYVVPDHDTGNDVSQSFPTVVGIVYPEGEGARMHSHINVMGVPAGYFGKKT